MPPLFDHDMTALYVTCHTFVGVAGYQVQLKLRLRHQARAQIRRGMVDTGIPADRPSVPRVSVSDAHTETTRLQTRSGVVAISLLLLRPFHVIAKS